MPVTLEEKMRAAFHLFLDNNHQPTEVIKRGLKQGFTEPQIREGMVRVWERVEAGEVIEAMDMAWQAWEEAKKAQGQEFMKYEQTREVLQERIKSQEKTRNGLILAIIIETLALMMIGFEVWHG